MSESKSSSGGSCLGSLIFVVFLVMKLTEKCVFWGNNFPRFLKSTEAWWDGWFMVFFPLWGGFIIALIILLIWFIFNWNKQEKSITAIFVIAKGGMLFLNLQANVISVMIVK